jgi:hypothetical protein
MIHVSYNVHWGHGRHHLVLCVFHVLMVMNYHRPVIHVFYHVQLQLVILVIAKVSSAWPILQPQL